MDRRADRIVCAANKVNNHIVCGARHYDEIMCKQMELINESFSSANVEQGFINQYGEFLSRQEAYIIATIAGQIIRRVGGDDNCLYSENLY